MKKNLYKKFQKVDKLKNNYKENFIVEKSQTIKTILSFFFYKLNMRHHSKINISSYLQPSLTCNFI